MAAHQASPSLGFSRQEHWSGLPFPSPMWKWKVKVQSLSRVRLLATPWTAAYQAPPSMGFSRQEYLSGVPLPSPKFNTAAAKSLQSCPTLCDPIDGSPPGPAVPGILQARTLEISISAWTHGYLFYILGYNPILLYFVAPMSHWYTPHQCGFKKIFFSNFLLFGIIWSSRLILYIFYTILG